MIQSANTFLVWVVYGCYYYYYYYYYHHRHPCYHVYAGYLQIIYLKQTMFLGYTVLQLFCVYNLRYM
jgi:hypothetical protein